MPAAVPLAACALADMSSGDTGSIPAYSAIRSSHEVYEALKFTLTMLAPAGSSATLAAKKIAWMRSPA